MVSVYTIKHLFYCITEENVIHRLLSPSLEWCLSAHQIVTACEASWHAGGLQKFFATPLSVVKLFHFLLSTYIWNTVHKRLDTKMIIIFCWWRSSCYLLCTVDIIFLFEMVSKTVTLPSSHFSCSSLKEFFICLCTECLSCTSIRFLWYFITFV